MAKITLQFDGERFGFRKNKWLSYVVPNDMPAEACYFLTWPFDFDIMIGWIGGQFGWEMSAAGQKAAIDFALEELVKMVGSDARKHFVKGHLTGWAQNPWTLGALCRRHSRPLRGACDLAKPLAKKRLFFAGEAVAAPNARRCLSEWRNVAKVATVIAGLLLKCSAVAITKTTVCRE